MALDNPSVAVGTVAPNALKLEMTVGNPRLSVFEGLRVELTLANGGSSAHELPGPDDASGALGFVVYGEDGSIVMRMDGLTGQKMISGARVDVRPFKDILAAGAEWKWTLDLSTLHYPLPAGTYHLEARLADEALGVNLRSDTTEIRVEDPDLIGMAPSRANPVMDGLALLFQSPSRDGAESPLVLRQYNALRPLAAWYSSPLPANLNADLAFCAQPAFFRPDSFDPFFSKWVIGLDGADLWAQLMDSGEAEGAALRAPLPQGRTVIPMAFLDKDDVLFLVLTPGPGVLELWAWEAGGLRLIFAHTLGMQNAPAPAAGAGMGTGLGGFALGGGGVISGAAAGGLGRMGSMGLGGAAGSNGWAIPAASSRSQPSAFAAGSKFALGADESGLHLAFESRGLVYRHLDWQGALLTEKRLHSTRLKAEWIEFDAAESLFRACFRDGTKGKTLHPVSVGWDGEPALQDTVDDLALRGDIGETRFQVDKGGRFHLVFTASGGSSGGSLYAWNRKRGLMRLAKDQERYFPMVMASGRIYFGYYRKGSGYRFVELNRGFGPRIREYR